MGIGWWCFLIPFFIAMVIFICRLVFAMLIPGIRQFKMESEVRKIGIGVNADIIHRSKTGMIDGEKPVYRMTFRFKTREGLEVQSSLERPLNMDDFGRYAPGNGVTLKYDPKDPKRIALSDRPLILGD
ncbi:hypothetical protein BBB57_20350 [Kosakonia sacchari]|uniref:DUF3592 domain-containing protein n=1 Tax=Kosakonia sacchari TaxID=1158459 RepID=UPI0008073E18|nr:DUF3592 domain-containing protein [Kosakonia sacchari]ANR80390.1 hypothetical protein BBB57_20350 [Kosakonia sacchari]